MRVFPLFLPVLVIPALLATSPSLADGVRMPDSPVGAPGPLGEHPRDQPVLDMSLAELYGITAAGYSGTYPFGTVAVSCVTTCCNVGEVVIPWLGPGAFALLHPHPFVGLAIFREDATGTLEMISESWIKHGFNAQPRNLCGVGCSSPADSLGVGCSDTYSATSNATRYYLGPREEVNPYTGAWEPCGSFFDGTPADCFRSYLGFEIDQTAHRLVVSDQDLSVSGATYSYEGTYTVVGERNPGDNTGWRECNAVWTGTSWVLSDAGVGAAPTPGLRVASWGDLQSTAKAAFNDGEVVLATRVTDLGGGQFHYEYALYNWRSARGVYSFEVPTGSASVSNVGFHDPDADGANDWPATVANGRVTWQTDDWSTDPAAHALRYQTMFNFRFDADTGPADTPVVCGIFEPGVGSAFSLSARAPAAGIPRAVAAVGSGAPALRLEGPNPFRTGTRLRLSLARRGTARVSVVDLAGRVVQVLVDGALPAGETDLVWHGRDLRGERAAAGVYFVRLDVAGAPGRTEKITLLR